MPRACLLYKVNIETEQINGKITCPNKVNKGGENNIGAPKMQIDFGDINCSFCNSWKSDNYMGSNTKRRSK